ncbi:ABC transporter permease [bacterium]|nr:ABC transporter permease [Chloroflexi bacterium CFX6]RIL11172.1 MAG: ABC transporter permease [bacterium]
MAVAELTFGAEDLARPEDQSQLQVVWGRFRRHKLAVAGLGIVIMLFTLAFIGPSVSPYDSTTIPTGADFAKARYLSPLSSWVDSEGESHFHVLGTDKTGRDYLTRLMEGGRVSLSLALVVTLLSSAIGIVVGSFSAYYGGWIDSFIMRVVDFMLTLPTLPIFLSVYTIIPQDSIPGGSITVLAIIFIAFGWIGDARLSRGMVLSLRNQEFADASRAVGASDARIIARHMIPNAIAPVLVSATLAVGGVVVAEAGLSFLGFGVQPPFPSWGNMVLAAQANMMSKPYEVFFPGMAIFLTSLSFNFIGDALRDALDPRLKL